MPNPARSLQVFLAHLCLLSVALSSQACNCSGPLSSKGIVALSCSTDQDCPTGQLCVQGTCQPTEAAIPPDAGQEGDPQGAPDGPAPEKGECTPRMAKVCIGYNQPPPPGFTGEPGYQICGSDGTWGPCIGAPTLSEETCNGIDDDRDGLFDNVKTGFCATQEIRIYAGRFQMGSPTSEPNRAVDEGPVHQVTLTRNVAVHKYEVTQGFYKMVTKTNPSWFGDCGDRCPVESVRWFEVLEFLNALSRARGFLPCFICERANGQVACALRARYEGAPASCLGYRLPTEAEWEYFARAGSKAALPDGQSATQSGCAFSAKLDKHAWYCGNARVSGRLCLPHQTTGTCVGTYPVGQKAANAWGLHDVLGNVAEWIYDGSFYKPYDQVHGPGLVTRYTSQPRQDPVFRHEGDCRMIRGGSWADGVGGNRLAARLCHVLNWPSFMVGFRPVRTLLE